MTVIISCSSIFDKDVDPVQTYLVVCYHMLTGCLNEKQDKPASR